jgi:hypothetical protein
MNPAFIAEKDLGYEQITGLSSVKALTVPTGTSMVIVTAETQGVRWRGDGTDPTATVGYPLASGNEMVFTAGNFTALRFIEQTASAKLNVYYFG